MTLREEAQERLSKAYKNSQIDEIVIELKSIDVMKRNRQLYNVIELRNKIEEAELKITQIERG